jgi:hypothetical protein
MAELVDDQRECTTEAAQRRRPGYDERARADAVDGKSRSEKYDRHEATSREDDRHRASGRSEAPARPMVK